MIKLKKRIDAHIHYALPLEPETLIAFMDKTGTDMAKHVKKMRKADPTYAKSAAAFFQNK